MGLEDKLDRGQRELESEKAEKERRQEEEKNIWEIHIQTPEGKQEKEDKEEFEGKVSQFAKRNTLESLQREDYQYIHKDDLIIAKKYGTDYAQGVYREQFHQKADKEVGEKLSEEHQVAQLDTDLENINKYSEYYDKTNKALGELRTQYRTTQDVLSQALDQNKKLKKYLDRDENKSSQDVAKNHLDYLLSQTGFSMFRQEKNEIQRIMEFMSSAGEYDKQINSLKSRSNVSQTENPPQSFPSPEKFQDIQARIAELQKFLKDLKDKIETNAEVEPSAMELYGVGKEFNNNRSQIAETELSKEMQNMLGRETFHEAERRVQATENEINVQAEAEKELLDANIELSWQRALVRQFEEESSGVTTNIHEIESKHEKLEKNRVKATTALKELSPMNKEHPRNALDKLLDDEITIVASGRETSADWYVKSERFDEEIEAKRTELQTANADVNGIEEQIQQKEGNKSEVRGLLKSTREKRVKAIDNQIKKLTTAKEAKEQARDTIKQDYNKLQKIQKKLADLSNYLKISDVGTQLNSKYREGKPTKLRELLNIDLPRHLENIKNDKLDESEQSLHNEYANLKEALKALEDGRKDIAEKCNTVRRDVSGILAALQFGKPLNEIRGLHKK